VYVVEKISVGFGCGEGILLILVVVDGKE